VTRNEALLARHRDLYDEIAGDPVEPDAAVSEPLASAADPIALGDPTGRDA
jgi:hypothetical protein